MSDPLRIANCSGFYGDRLDAAREMVEGGPIDVLTGDYLAELTLTILLKDKLRNPELGYARSFLRQLEQVAARCSERGIRIVVNAGGLNPAGLARAAEKIYAKLGLRAAIAHIEGDDLLPRLAELQEKGESLAHLDRGMPLSSLQEEVQSANAYLGAFGIAEALSRGADLVICPRVTDASLVLGPAIWRFGWARDDWDRLAAGIVAGHVVECGAQCTGGNYAFFREVPSLVRPGFPIAEMSEDGSFVITKHAGTDGLVSVGTVTAQLLYEIAGPHYPNPDATARFDTIRLEQQSTDRVRVSGVRGEPPPATTKICINHLGGYRNSVTFALPGLDIDAKARVIEEGFWPLVGGREHFAETRTTLRRGAAEGSERLALLTLAVRSSDPERVGRAFWNAAIEMGLASYPGYELLNSSRTASQIAVYWPALVSSREIDERVVMGGESWHVPPPEPPGQPAPIEPPPPLSGEPPGGPARDAPLGAVFGARSGDKGGNANLGIWARTPRAYLWLEAFLTAEKLRELYPELRERQLDVERHCLPNLLALNFVIPGLLDYGVSATLRTDPQAKILSEELRASVVPIPVCLLETEGERS